MKRLLILPVLLLMIVTSCQNNGSDNEKAQALSDSTSVTGVTGDFVKLVKTARIAIKVNDVEKAAWGVSALAGQLGGKIFHQNLEAIEGERKELKLSNDSLLVVTAYTPHADLSVRVPSEQLEMFLHNMAEMGYYTQSSQLNIDDKSLDYLENALKQENRQQALLQSGRSNKAPGLMPSIHVKDAMIEQAITNRAIDADVAYSLVNISLFQNSLIRKEKIANYILSGYELPFHKRLLNAIGDGWEIFLGFLLFLAHFWVFLLVAGILWISYRYVQSRKIVFKDSLVR